MYSGSSLITADGVAGVSGKPIRIFSIHILSGGGGGGVVALKSGTATGGTIWIQQTGTASTGATFSYGTQGFLFPSGCYVDIDANVTSVLIEFTQEA